MSRLFLCLGGAFLAAGLAAALFGFGVASDEDLPGARAGSLVAAGLAIVTLGSGVLLRRWERTVGDLPARRTGSNARRPRAETPGGRAVIPTYFDELAEALRACSRFRPDECSPTTRPTPTAARPRRCWLKTPVFYGPDW